LPTAIVLALAAAHSTVYAQEELEEVMITDSRIHNTRAMQTPNPVTVVTLDQNNVSSPTTMIEGPGRIAPVLWFQHHCQHREFLYHFGCRQFESEGAAGQTYPEFAEWPKRGVVHPLRVA